MGRSRWVDAVAGLYYGGAFRMDVLCALILGIALLATALMGAVRAVERRGPALDPLSGDPSRRQT